MLKKDQSRRGQSIHILGILHPWLRQLINSIKVLQEVEARMLFIAQQPTTGESVIVGNGQELPVTHIGNVLNSGFAYEEGPSQRAK
nr:hypothetical protein CFP56_40447 [Quercus suber]